MSSNPPPPTSQDAYLLAWHRRMAEIKSQAIPPCDDPVIVASRRPLSPYRDMYAADENAPRSTP